MAEVATATPLEQWLFEVPARRITKARTPEGKIIFFKQVRDFQFIDRVDIEVHPRFKSSHLSGDEWRVSASLVLSCKGEPVVRRGFHKVEHAAAKLPGLLLELDTLGFDDKEVARAMDAARDRVSTGKVCMQPGCNAAATVHLRLKQEFAESTPVPPSSITELRRAFCEMHKVRGDQSFEDCDANYEEVNPVAKSRHLNGRRKRNWIV